MYWRMHIQYTCQYIDNQSDNRRTDGGTDRQTYITDRQFDREKDVLCCFWSKLLVSVLSAYLLMQLSVHAVYVWAHTTEDWLLQAKRSVCLSLSLSLSVRLSLSLSLSLSLWHSLIHSRCTVTWSYSGSPFDAVSSGGSWRFDFAAACIHRNRTESNLEDITSWPWTLRPKTFTP